MKAFENQDELHRQISEILRKSSQRYTKPRRRLIETLYLSQSPIILPEILKLNKSLSQSSAYRNLETLEQHAIVNKITTAGEFASYELAEPFLHHHHHLICRECHSVKDILLQDQLEEAIDKALTDAAKKLGFIPTTHTVDVYGYCQPCNPKS